MKNEKRKNVIRLEPKVITGGPEELPQLALECVRAVVSALEEKDPYTHGHSIRVAELCALLGQSIGLSDNEITELELCGLLHDVGKIGIPDHVLLKPGKLTKAEFEIMKSHPVRSAKIMEKISCFQNLLPGIRFHHERMDGLGYPDGLKGEEIPLYSRIILVVDTFDAMTSTRPYRLALPKEVAFEELLRCSGTQFEKRLVDAFIEAIRTQDAKKSSSRVSWLQKIA